MSDISRPFFRFVFPVDATNEDDDEADYERDRVNHQLAEVEWLPMVDTEVIKYDLLSLIHI